LAHRSNTTTNPAEPAGRWHSSLSLIRKRLTTTGWEHIAIHCDDFWLTVPLNARFRPGGRASGGLDSSMPNLAVQLIAPGVVGTPH
jgi:hypothetical protein